MDDMWMTYYTRYFFFTNIRQRIEIVKKIMTSGSVIIEDPDASFDILLMDDNAHEKNIDFTHNHDAICNLKLTIDCVYDPNCAWSPNKGICVSKLNGTESVMAAYQLVRSDLHLVYRGLPVPKGFTVDWPGMRRSDNEILHVVPVTMPVGRKISVRRR